MVAPSAKLFFRIGEVAELVGVNPRVLRYWADELGILQPMKTRGSHRQFRRRDVEIARHLKRLLEDDGLTAEGARKRLRELGYSEVGARARRPAAKDRREPDLRSELTALRGELVAANARAQALSKPVRRARIELAPDADEAARA